MTVISKKGVLWREIKEILDGESYKPQFLSFCEGLGKSIFKITIQKEENNIYIDENGQKWIKVEKE